MKAQVTAKAQATAILILSILAITFAGPTQAQNYAYFNPTDDAYVDSASPNGNFGSSINLYTGDRTPAAGGSTLFFLQFDISAFEASNEILHAELWLRKHEKYGAPDQQCAVSAHHILAPGWDENTITWNAPPAYATMATAINTGTFNPPGWEVWNVTSDVIVDRPSGITGWCVKMNPEIQWMWLNFYSREQVPMPDYRPMLEIMYSGPVATEQSTLDQVKALYR